MRTENKNFSIIPIPKCLSSLIHSSSKSPLHPGEHSPKRLGQQRHQVQTRPERGEGAGSPFSHWWWWCHHRDCSLLRRPCNLSNSPTERTKILSEGAQNCSLVTTVASQESAYPSELLPKSILSGQTPPNDSSLQAMNKKSLARSRTSAKCRFSRCSLFRILSISHCRSSIMDSSTDTRDSAVSTLLCNLENYIPKTGIQKNIPKKKKRD